MRLRPVTLVVTFALGLLAAPLPAEAQQAGKVYRIGFLGIGSPGSLRRIKLKPPPNHIALWKRLRELGYEFVKEYRYAEGKRERLPDLAAELVRLKVDVIVSAAVPAIRAAQRATHTIPIVMTGANIDPVEAGLVVSLARPGGNVTGLTNLESKLHPKRLELLKEAFPRISRVAILWSRAQQKNAMKEVEAVGEALGIQIQSVVAATRYVTPLDELKSAFSAISRGRPEALLVASFGLTIGHRARVIDFAAKKRLPTMYARRLFVNAGGLMSYGANSPHLFRLAATYVDKILKGAKPGDLPVEQPTKFEMIINLKTAKKQGLTISPQFLARANKVIK